MLLQPSSKFTKLGGHVAICASLPSGRSSVVAVRERLSSLLTCAGMMPSLDCDVGCFCPSVRHLNEGACRYRPDALFVGTVDNIVDVSPWSLPLPEAEFYDNAFFLFSRADLRALLWPLRNKTLVCNCSSYPQSCWALLLKVAFCNEFDFDPAKEYVSSYGDEGLVDEFSDIYVDDYGYGSFQEPALKDIVHASGKQASRHRPRQLVPNGLTPNEHLSSAMTTTHPYLTHSCSTSAVHLALSGDRWPGHRLNAWRIEVVGALKLLALELSTDEDQMLSLVAEPVGAVLKAYSEKKIAFMREVCFICCPQDYAAVSCLTVGLPMLNWAPPAFGLLERVRPPVMTYDEWRSCRERRNQKVINRIQSSGDLTLDTGAFRKTMDEVYAGVLKGPFYKFEDVPFRSISLAPRSGIWECHGDAVDPTIRNIDDFLFGEQNMTAGSTHSHRPTDVDSLVAQTRAVARALPNSRLSGWLSDFAKAYKQVPGDPTQLPDVVLAQFDPVLGCVAFFVPLCLVFGSKTAPLNFARFPAMFCELVARLFRLPATHCVDDVIFIEDVDSAGSGKQSWDAFVSLAGWLMSSSKEFDPSQIFNAIGVSVDLRSFPCHDPTIMITMRRVNALRQLLVSILKKGKLGSGEAASLAGKLGFSMSATFGRFGRCRLRPIFSRAHSKARNMDHELVTCLKWWVQFLNTFEPRPVPTRLESLPFAISYSDGEGASAGIGAAIWHPHYERPLAVYCEVPSFIRDHWRTVSGTEGYHDIFFVEALGPIILLVTFPNVLRNCLWLHFIDNAAAEASLIRGTSSSEVGDHIVGFTWTLIQKKRLWPYFDRVESKANPVDGLSRQRFAGPWERVQMIDFPVQQILEFAASF